MDIKHLPYAPGASDGRIGELLHRIGDDVRTIASDEVELAKGELSHSAKAAIGDAAVIVLSGMVGLIGLGLLCVAIVVALAPVIPPLWLRLVVMALVYMAAGGAVARTFAKRLGHDATPDFGGAVAEAKHTAENIKDGLRR